jgi:hypothetical protein
MAIAFDAATDGGVVTATSLTWSHTCTGSNLILLVGFNGSSAGGTDDITGVTYNGVSMTLAAKKDPTGGDRILYVYYLIGPATGAHNVVISASSSHNLSGGAVSYTGALQSGQPDNTTTNVEVSSSSKTLTTSLTTVADNCWTVLLEGCYDASAGPTAGTGATRRIFDGNFGAWGLFDSNGLIHPAGSYSMTTNRSADPFGLLIAHVMVSIAPDTGGGGTDQPIEKRHGGVPFMSAQQLRGGVRGGVW